VSCLPEGQRGTVGNYVDLVVHQGAVYMDELLLALPFLGGATWLDLKRLHGSFWVVADEAGGGFG